MARLTGLEPATPGVTGRYSNHLSYNRAYIELVRSKSKNLSLPPGSDRINRSSVARLTGLEPATPGVTGRYSNHLSYNRSLRQVPYGRLRERLSMQAGVQRQAEFHQKRNKMHAPVKNLNGLWTKPMKT